MNESIKHGSDDENTLNIVAAEVKPQDKRVSLAMNMQDSIVGSTVTIGLTIKDSEIDVYTSIER